jgi:undecaprenyl-diphosphatase
MITYLQSLILGLLQGITELFPISSLGHSVLLPWLLNWHGIEADQTKNQSFYLYYVVLLHVATALALVLFYRKTWIRIIVGFWRSIRLRKIDTADGRLAWLLIIATIPAGIVGLVFESELRSLFSKPLAAIIFLALNGVILLVADTTVRNRQRSHGRHRNSQATANTAGGLSNTTAQVSDTVTFKRAFIIGVAQVGALCAGISRSGITMAGGLFSGLSNEDAARFSFLLATPVILGAGLIKLPKVLSSQYANLHGQFAIGAIAAAVAAYIAVRYLDKYFQNRSLRPFAYYCWIFAGLMIVVGLMRGHF